MSTYAYAVSLLQRAPGKLIPQTPPSREIGCAEQSRNQVYFPCQEYPGLGVWVVGKVFMKSGMFARNTHTHTATNNNQSNPPKQNPSWEIWPYLGAVRGLPPRLRRQRPVAGVRVW